MYTCMRERGEKWKRHIKVTIHTHTHAHTYNACVYKQGSILSRFGMNNGSDKL